MDKLEQMLVEAGVKPTALRLLIFREIAALGGAFSLGEMEARLETVDKSTIFRALTLFLEHGLLHEIDDGSSCRKYCRSSHVHFNCTSCHKTVCLEGVTIPTIVVPEGFRVEQVNCVVKGLCPDCAKRKS